MKTILLIPYFGKWPNWMDYFLLSCGQNRDFNWLLISNAGKPGSCPENVRYLEMSLQEFSSVASEKLGLDIEIINPYKICDLRPAFGKIFGDYLEGFDFWGYSDIDLVYGNLNSFLGKNLLSGIDMLSCRKEYMSGHFALYRNTGSINELFKIPVIYKQVFEDFSRHYAYDERSNIFGRKLITDPSGLKIKNRLTAVEKLWNASRFKLGIGIPPKPRDISSLVSILESRQEIRVFRKDIVKSDKWFSDRNINDWEIIWEKGRLFEKESQKELLHFHFLQNKSNPGFNVHPFASVSLSGSESGLEPGLEPGQGFRITPEGIRPINS